MFCGMGVCQECLVEVDGRPNQRACMTKVAAGMAVRRNVEDRRAKPRPKPPRHHRRHPGERARDSRHRRRPGRPFRGDRRAAAGRRGRGGRRALAARRAIFQAARRSAGGAPADRQHQEGAAPRSISRDRSASKIHSGVAGLGRLRPARARREPRRPHAAPPPPAADRGDRRLRARRARCRAGRCPA